MTATNAHNPLLTDYDLPPFDEIEPEQIQPAVQQTLQQSRSEIEALLSDLDDVTWENLMLPLETLGNMLDKRWSPISHMNAVTNSKPLRAAYDSCLPLLSEYSTWLGQNQTLYEKIQTLFQRREELQLDETQVKILTDEIRGFDLAGVSLPPEKKQRYGEIQARLSELSSKYEQNILDATMAWQKQVTDPEQLAGLPESALALLEQNAKQQDLDGALINLEFPCYYAVMSHAQNRALREEVYRAYTTRASELTDEGQFDNAPVMQEIIQLRRELANLLDFNSYSELSLATKMADTPQQVIAFLQDLAARSKPQAQQELAELADFAADTLAIETLEPWDIAFASERLREQKFSVSDEELRPYFPVNTVLKGLFSITQQLFDVTIVEITDDFNRWHQDARLFELQSNSGERIARFYFDLYARQNKRGGAWMADYCSRFKQADGALQKPVAFLTCNFNPPVGDKPALLTHDEVVTLFHEFGHGLHHMLTQVDYLSVSGINGVEWDAVELPSQFLENFCYQEAGLAQLSGHYLSGDPLPDNLREKLIAARNFQSAMMMVRQLEFSLFDFHLHSQTPDQPINIKEVLDRVRAEVAVVIPPSWNRFENSFSHIFAGGYSAGYYSYKWAEVLSADAFSRFEEEGIFNPAIGRAFKQAILERGGSKPAMELFTEFRGREPQVEPLLRHSGIGI
ncbi:MAG: M3 family metallopeptidase [Gammaproteobacteria bacterium]|nr:M3 family metallopeptidase [Gammaproteobacteria bacterium]